MKLIPIRKAIVWIILSTFIISGSSYLAFMYYLYLKQLRANDDKYKIIALVQTCPDKECLKTVYLAELLNLSVDEPTNLYRFNSEDAIKKLHGSPLIKKASIKKISPGTIYVDYSLRIPIAFLGNHTNTAIDEEGYAFPFKPFFTPKRLPEILLGSEINEEDSLWGKQIKGKCAELAFALLPFINQLCTKNHTFLQRLDVTQAYASSYGQRQIVIVFEDQHEKSSKPYTYTMTLRLSTEDVFQQLANYFVLRQHLLEKDHQEFIIDLRIPELAFITGDSL